MDSINERLDPKSVQASGNPLNPDRYAGREETRHPTSTHTDRTPEYSLVRVMGALNRMEREGHIRGWERRNGSEWIVRLDAKTRSFSREGVERFLELHGEPDAPPVLREDVKERYPRIIEHMQASYILAEGEAVAALTSYIRGINHGCEAVQHAGGPKTILEHISRDHSRRHNRKTWLS